MPDDDLEAIADNFTLRINVGHKTHNYRSRIPMPAKWLRQLRRRKAKLHRTVAVSLSPVQSRTIQRP